MTFSDAVAALDTAAAAGAVPGTLDGAAVVEATGKVELGSTAEPELAGTAGGVGFVTATGLNSDGLPLALFHPS